MQALEGWGRGMRIWLWEGGCPPCKSPLREWGVEAEGTVVRCDYLFLGLSEDFRRFDSRFAYAKREQHFSKICLSHFVFEEIFLSGDFFPEISINVPYTCERERTVRARRGARNTSCS